MEFHSPHYLVYSELPSTRRKVRRGTRPSSYGRATSVPLPMVELLPSLFLRLRQLSIGRIGMSFSYICGELILLSVIHVVLMLSRMPLGTIEYSLPARLLIKLARTGKSFCRKAKNVGIVLFFLFILGWPIALFFLEGILHYLGLFPVSPRGLFRSFFS